MAFYVDTQGAWTECVTIQEARAVAALQLESARDFRDRMGWVPFWGREGVTIRTGPSGLSTWFSCEPEFWSRTRVKEVVKLEE